MVDDEAITHFCAGTTDEKKNNKPKGTQIDTSKWFNPTTLDEETKVSKCNACASEHQPGEPVTIIGGS
jgi:hypothetical protein